MRHRKPILWGLAISEMLTLGYAAVAVSRFVNVHEMGWGGFVSIDIPIDIVWPLAIALAIGIGFVVILTTSEHTN